MLDTVIHNDCLTVLRDMADNSVEAPDLWTQDMHDAEDVFIAEGGYEGEVSV